MKMERPNLVVLIGGKGTSGKSTFISYMREIWGDKCGEFSTIDPVKELVKKIAEMEFYEIIHSMVDKPAWDKVKYVQNESNFIKMVNEKNDTYRSFLHDLKMLWCNFSDGPNVITFTRVKSFFNDGGKCAFVNCREPEQFEHIKKVLAEDQPTWKVCTLQIVRPGAGEDITNEGDRTTDNYTYDHTIVNDGTLEDLKEKAYQFDTMIHTKYIQYEYEN